jgi:hypothetical protein
MSKVLPVESIGTSYKAGQSQHGSNLFVLIHQFERKHLNFNKRFEILKNGQE